eukprot:COSAG02_NODE_3433_length_6750_cov_29.777477_4_plen_57_part_00
MYTSIYAACVRGGRAGVRPRGVAGLRLDPAKCVRVIAGESTRLVEESRIIGRASII